MQKKVLAITNFKEYLSKRLKLFQWHFTVAVAFTRKPTDSVFPAHTDMSEHAGALL